MRVANRRQLVGLLTSDPQVVLDEGAQITESRVPKIGEPALGHVTSSYMSPTLGRSIALALVAGGRSRVDETLFASTPTGAAAARIVDFVFFDKEGARIDA
jgi:sarcosine oxidase subunit alpha